MPLFSVLKSFIISYMVNVLPYLQIINRLQILNPSKGLPAYSAMRMQHYAIFLQGFDFDIKYRKTKNHGNADGLSRLPIKESIANHDALDVYTIDTVNMLLAKASEI